MSTRSQPLIIWRFSDRRPGHDAQSRGLCTALSGLAPCQVFDIQATSGPQLWSGLLIRRFEPGRSLPAPDLIIGAGHPTHLPMLCARLARGGKILVLMSPSLPVAWFDLCLIPAHDRPASGDNVLVTRGALNTVVPSGTKNPQQGLILIGGPSRHYDWDENKLLAQIRRVVENSPTQWSMTDSARTPAQTRQALQTVSSKNLLYYPCSETPPGWVASRLVETAYVWVTEDSISMIYEALTSAAAVGVFDVPAKNNDRIVAAISQLAREGLVLRYDDWCNGEPLVPLKTPLHESARCARYVLDKFSPASVR